MSLFSSDALEASLLELQKRNSGDSDLTVEILGKIAICAMISDNDQQQQLSSEIIEKFYLERLDRAPASIRNILHPEYNIDGVRLLESTEMILGVQKAGIAGRLNPDYGYLHVKWPQTKAKALLQHYSSEFPNEVQWVEGEVGGPVGG